MRDLPDDPIVASILRTGYPPWMEPEYRTVDDEDEEDEDDDSTLTWSELYALYKKRKGGEEDAL